MSSILPTVSLKQEHVWRKSSKYLKQHFDLYIESVYLSGEFRNIGIQNLKIRADWDISDNMWICKYIPCFYLNKVFLE